MVLDSILPVLAELIKDPIKNYVVIPIKRHFSYAFKCDTTVGKLKEQTEQLENKRVRLQKRVDEAERNGEHIYENVTNWLSSAEAEIQEAEQLIQSKEKAKKKCCVGFCPNLKTRYQLSKKAAKKALSIEKLQNKEGLDPISFREAPQQIVEPSVYSREALPSRVVILKQVMDALKDPNLHMIGVYGMGGIGKTTLAKEVHRKAVEEKLFDSVVMVAVSQTPELRRIQGEIADFLGMKFTAEEVPGRASQLYEKLKKSKVLIILDDIWAKLELRSVGIPFGDEGKGCKILLTSRSKDVLCRETGTQKEFSLEVLPEEESWRLFETTVAEAKNEKFQAIATEVANKCAGLPLLILMAASDLRNKDLYAWNDMDKQLSAFGNEEIHERVHRVLKLSYENLRGKELKSFFLLCALYGRSNIQIRDLVRYSMGLGLLKDTRTIEDARNRVFRWISKLKDESLLLDGDKVGYVKMHDVVRETALLITCGDQNAFIGRNGVRLQEWPGKDCTRISLPFCDIHDLPQGLECPEAELFLLFTEDFRLKIPDLFFEGIRELRVMGFTGIHFARQLPSSLGFLTKLQTLCLEGCKLYDIAIIGELKQLECLSFAGSNIVELPREIEQLSQLKLLDLSMCRKLKVIPANVLSKLSLLEELYIYDSFVGWDEEGKASVMELDELCHLTTLEILAIDAKKIPNLLFSRELRRYRIALGGDELYWFNKLETSATLKLIRLQRSIQMEHGLKKLLKGTEDLYLNEVRGIENWLFDIDGEGCQQLKHLHINNDDVIRNVINSTMLESCSAFPVLRALFLKNLNSLEEICHGRLATDSFSKLRTLHINKCNKLRNLLSYSFAKCLSHLQEITVIDCANMEAIIGEGSEDEAIEFTQLSSLELSGLPCLGSIFGEKVSFSNLTSLYIGYCHNLKYVFQASALKSLLQLKRLEISNCHSIEEIILTEEIEEEEKINNKIVFLNLEFLGLRSLQNLIRFGSGHSIEFQSLREIEIKNCDALKNFVNHISNRGNSSHIQSLFNHTVIPNLETLLLDRKNLKTISVEHFSKLKKIEVHDLRERDSVILFGFLRRLHSLEILALSNSSLEEQFSLDDERPIILALKCLELTWLSNLKHIWMLDSPRFVLLQTLKVESCFGLMNIAATSVSLQNLTTLHVSFCNELKNLVTPSTAQSMKHLMELKIRNCKMMTEIVANDGDDAEHEIVFSQLKYLELSDLPALNSFCSGNYTFHFPLLEEVIVEQCLQMKFFSVRLSFTPKLRGIKRAKYTSEVYWKGNLNATIASQLTEWVGIHFNPKIFPNVKSLQVEKSPSSSTIIPSNQLQFLNNLTEIKVRGCDSVQVVFDLEDVTAEDGDARLLPQLEKLELINLPLLSQLWNKDPVEILDFSNLRCLKVENCSSLKYVFTLSMASRLIELQEVQIEKCEMMEAMIKQVEADQESVFAKMTLPSLRSVALKRLSKYLSIYSGIGILKCPSLEEMTIIDCPSIKGFISTTHDEGRGQILDMQELHQVSFSNLTNLYISFCHNLKYVFQTSTLKGHLQLKRLEISCCCSIEEIILTKEIEEEEKINNKIVFLNLEFLRLRSLQNLIRFGSGHSIEFQSLREIEIENCDALKNFVNHISNGGNSSHIQSLFNHTVIPNLETLLLDGKYLEAISVEHFPKLKKIEVYDLRERDSNILFGFLRRLHSLKILVLSNSCLEEPFSLDDERPVILALKCLELRELSSLKHIWMLDSTRFVLKCLQTLEVESCSSLMNIAATSVSLRNLTTLHVSFCPELKNLVTPSTAQTMKHLTELKISDCKMMTEIVANDGDDAEHEIVFSQLKYLELYNLPALNSFCSGNYTFHFPLLEEVIVEQCLQMKFFSGRLSFTPNLRGIEGKYTSEVHWKGNLNATIASQLTEWVGIHFDPKIFPNVKSLQVEKSPSSSTIIPSNQLQFLNNLTEIKVRGCDSVQVVFDLEDVTAEDGDARLLPQLEKLELINLPLLSQLWNKDPVEILDFSNLRCLKVENCSSLKYVFTPSMASRLIELQEVQIEKCEMMEAIIKQEEVDQESVLATIKLSALRSVVLKRLSKYLSIYSGIGILECPSLKEMTIIDCPSIKGFLSTTHDEGRGQILDMQELHQIAIPGLEKLSIEWQLIKDNLNGDNQQEFLSTLKVIELIGFQGECAVFPFQNFPNMKALVLRDSLVEEIVIQESLPWLKKVELYNLSKLKHVVDVDHHPETVSFIQNLEELQVRECSRLKILVPSSIFFKNLTFLLVSKCDGLINLITASTAQSFRQLKELYVKECKIIQEIVAIESNREENKICFTELENLELVDLPCLASFCSGNYALDFPCLDEVYVAECPNMTMFAQQVLSTPKLSCVRTGRREWNWNGSLNKTIESLSM